MKKLLLVAILNVSFSMFSMKEYGEGTFLNLENGYKYTISESSNKNNSELYCGSFPLTISEKPYAHLWIELNSNLKLNEHTTKANVYFTHEYCNGNKNNDAWGSNNLKALLADIENFKKKYFSSVVFFLEKKFVSKQTVNDLKKMVTSVLEESPEIPFPKAYYEKQQIHDVYELAKNNKTFKLKHF